MAKYPCFTSSGGVISQLTITLSKTLQMRTFLLVIDYFMEVYITFRQHLFKSKMKNTGKI